ncbi:hypothetical protein ACN268_16595 [Micromonospora sp. WMMD735]
MTRTPAVTAVVVAGVTCGCDATPGTRPARPGPAGKATRPARADRKPPR